MENNIIIYYYVASLVVLLLVVAIVSYAFLHQKKVIQLQTLLHEEELRRRQAIFDALQDGQEKERTRLARELHDGIGARLSGLKMNLEYLDMNAREYKDLIAKVFQGLSETLEEVREVSHNLLPYQLYGKELRELLQNCIEQFNAYGGCSYDLSMDHVEADVSETIKMHLYRITAELLNNIHKHARATIASIQISIEEGIIEIIVEDNGIGFEWDTLKPDGIGLANIRSRVDVCKGTLNVDSSVKGTSVIIEIPLNPNA